MIRLKIPPLLLHITCWLLFMSFPLIFISQERGFNSLTAEMFSAYLSFCGLYVSVFYINTQFIIPKFFLQRKYLAYASSILLMFTAVYLLKPFDTLVNRTSAKPEMQHGPPHQGYAPPPDHEHFGAPPQKRSEGPAFRTPGVADRFDITGLFIFIMIIGIGTAFESMKQWYLFEQRSIRAEAEKANAELSFLKAQINPHFLYNTLNNIYTLCVTGNPNAADSVMKLSNIMRYVTDESDADFVPLEKEIDCISNFVALQELRLGKKTTLNYTLKGNPEGHHITPLILMTYVENVFKYGLSNHVPAFIIISITIEGDKITLYTSNQIFEHKKAEKRKGVGHENTLKRLNHLYPGQYQLSITQEDGFYTVLLVLDSK